MSECDSELVTLHAFRHVQPCSLSLARSSCSLFDAPRCPLLKAPRRAPSVLSVYRAGFRRRVRKSDTYQNDTLLPLLELLGTRLLHTISHSPPRFLPDIHAIPWMQNSAKVVTRHFGRDGFEVP